MRQSHILVITCCLLLAASMPHDEPSSCLLQQQSSPLQRTVLAQAGREDPHHGNSNEDKDSEDGSHSDHASNDNHGKDDKSDKPEGNNGNNNNYNDDSDNSDGQSNNDESEGSNKTEKKMQDNAPEEMEDSPLASLRLELRLPTSLQDLKETKGPLSQFLERLARTLADVAKIPAERVDVLGVRGAYSDSGVLLLEKDLKASLSDGPVRAEERKYSIVDLEILPSTHVSELSPKGVYELLKDQLSNKDSELKRGPLKDYLLGARLNMRSGVEGLLPHEMIEPNKAGSLTMTLPFLMIVATFLLSVLL